MTTTIDSKTDVYSRPNARFGDDGTLEIRASAVGNCRRALWYEANEYPVTNARTEESLTVLEAGNALEPVVLRAMRRAGWEIDATDRDNPEMMSLRLGPTLVVTGHVDATGVVPIFGDEPSVIEIKTRGPEAYKRWWKLGAERSHPESVAQAAFYSYGTFGEARDVVIATMDTGSRQWDFEVIPAERVATAFHRACERLGTIGAHHLLHGRDSQALPERDFTADDWQCKRCPFLNTCLPGSAAVGPESEDEDPENAEPVNDEEAQAALREYENAQEMLKAIERGQAVGLGDAADLAQAAGQGQGPVGGEGEDPNRGDGEVHPLQRRSQEAERPAGPRDEGGHRHRERVRVPAGQLGQHRPGDALHGVGHRRNPAAPGHRPGAQGRRVGDRLALGGGVGQARRSLRQLR